MEDEDDEVDRDLAGSESLTGDEGGFDDDDDMGDRMSSSPSIADGVYSVHRTEKEWVHGRLIACVLNRGYRFRNGLCTAYVHGDCGRSSECYQGRAYGAS